MSDTPTGITFREVMAGGFSLGETDPEAGERKGKAAGQILAMHAVITIPDMERFIADPAHAGQIAGSLDYPPLGMGLPAKGGVFNLFSPTDQPGLKHMVYEMAFEHGGEDYYLAGWKEVRNDAGLDLWKDTTTLHTRLHRGMDKEAPVVGAGVLTLGPLELMKLVSTLRALNAPSATAGGRAIAVFGRFFLGELWDSYLRS